MWLDLKLSQLNNIETAIINQKKKSNNNNNYWKYKI